MFQKESFRKNVRTSYEEILPPDESRVMEKAKFTYSLLEKTF